MRKVFITLTVVAILMMGISGAAFAKPPWLENGKGNFIPPGLLKKAIQVGFKDVKKDHWAAEAIERMVLKGVIQGYEDNTFKGNKPVTKLEALVMSVRLLGLEDEAKERKSVEPVFSRYAWGKNYVALAVEHNIIAPEDLINFKPNEPAKRYEIAVLLARALDLEDEATEAENDSLPYRDWYKIPERCRGYVTVMVENGYLTGYPNGKFHPYKPITRAEMAKLLDRIDDDVESDIDSGEIKGWIQEVDLEDEFIIVENKELGEIEVELNDDAAIFIDDEKSDFDDLEEGLYAWIILNSDGEAIFITCKEKEEAEEDELEGTIEELKLSSGDYFITIETEDGLEGPFEIDEDVEISDEDDEIDISDLDLGTYVYLELEDEKVVEIVVDTDSEEEEYEGIIKDVDKEDDDLYLVEVEVEDEEYEWELTEDTELKMEEETVYPSELVRGSECVVVIDDEEIIEMEVERIKVEGEIVQIGGNNDDGYFLGIETEDGMRGPFVLAEDVSLEKDREDIDFTEIYIGDEIEAIVHEGEIVEAEIE